MSGDAVEVFGPLPTAEGAPTLVSLSGGLHGGVNVLGSSSGRTTGSKIFLFLSIDTYFCHLHSR